MTKKTARENGGRRRWSWMKRFREFFVRRVFRRRLRPEESPPKPVIAEPEEIRKTAVEIAKQRKRPCYFLFLGLAQSGKSTTVSKLFNCERPKPEADEELGPTFKVYKNLNVGQGIGLEIVDAPGLLGRNTMEQDAEIIVALSSLLKRELPARIPTVTFIVARLDDSRFEGEQSDFTRMLNALFLIRKYITDHTFSNVILLLTHAQKAEVQHDGVSHRVQRYQDAFSRVFPSKDLAVIAVDSIRERADGSQTPGISKRYHDLIFDTLRATGDKRGEDSLSELVGWITGKSKRFSISFAKEAMPVRFLLPPRRALVHNITSCLMSNDPKGFNPDLETDEPGPLDIKKCEPYFVCYDTPTRKKRKRALSVNRTSPPLKLFTFIPSGSEVVLANKSKIKIDECLIGDKVLGLHHCPSVIIGIKSSTLEEILKEGLSVGSIYCATKMKDDMANDKQSHFIFTYQNDSFKIVNAANANIPEKSLSSTILYFMLELDSADGTIIVNGIPCMTQCEQLKQ